jgi:hypothetical protein
MVWVSEAGSVKVVVAALVELNTPAVHVLVQA